MNNDIKITITAPEHLIDSIAQKIIEITGLDKKVLNIANDNLIDRTYTVNEVAEITGKGANTIRRHIDSGLLKAKKVGKPFIITQTNLDNYVKGQ